MRRAPTAGVKSRDPEADNEGELSTQETAAVAALMSEPSIARAAAQIGIHERTLRRWMDRDDFRRVLRREQRLVMAGVTARLQSVATKALEALEDVLDDGESPHASRVTAARAVLELAHERIELDGLVERIETIERAHQRKGVH